MNQQRLLVVFDREPIVILVVIDVGHLPAAPQWKGALGILGEVDVIHSVRVVVVSRQNDLADELFDALRLEIGTALKRRWKVIRRMRCKRKLTEMNYHSMNNFNRYKQLIVLKQYQGGAWYFHTFILLEQETHHFEARLATKDAMRSVAHQQYSIFLLSDVSNVTRPNLQEQEMRETEGSQDMSPRGSADEGK